MTRRTKKLVGSVVLILSVFPLFTNCSELHSHVTESSSVLPPDTILSGVARTTAVNQKALLSSDQILKSMSSVTGINADNDVLNEYSREKDVLAGNFDLTSVTPPMLIAITNLAGKFCNKLVTKESQQSDLTQRKFFQTINFGMKPENLSAADFGASVQALASAFWGHEPTNEELDQFNQARLDFLNGRDSSKSQTTTSASFMVFICTGMLASFDSYTL